MAVRLPRLSGIALWIFRFAWVAVFGVALLFSTYFAYRGEVTTKRGALANYHAGIIVDYYSPTGYRIAPFSLEAERKGIKRGDILWAIDGQPWGEDFDLRDRLLDGPEGSHVTLTLRRDDRTFDVTLTRSARYLDQAYAGSGLTFSLRRWIGFGFQATGDLLVLAAALLLFIRRSRDPVAALLSLGLALGSLADNFYFSTRLPEAAASLVSLAAELMLLLGCLLFPNGKFKPRFTWIAFLGIALFALLSVFAIWNDAARPLAFALSLVTPALLIVLLYLRFRSTTDTSTRQQLKYAFLGFACALAFQVLAVLSDKLTLDLSSQGARAWLLLANAGFGGLSMVTFAAGLLIALLRYRLYDADALISRSVAYAFLTVLVGAIFAGSEKIIEFFGGALFGANVGILSAAFAAAAAAGIVAPLHDIVHRLAEERFQKSLTKLRQGIPKIVLDMREFASLDQLLSAILSGLRHGVRASRGAIFLSGGEGLKLAKVYDVEPVRAEEWVGRWQPSSHGAFELDRDDALFPVKIPLCNEAAGFVGWIMLGPRPDGSLYGKDERDALWEVADPIARAIHVVQQRELSEEKRSSRDRAMEERLSALEDLIQQGRARHATG